MDTPNPDIDVYRSIQRRKLIMYIAGACVLLAFGIYVIYKNPKNPMRVATYSRVLMGTVVEIGLTDGNYVAANEAFEEIARLEKVFSSYMPDSEVSRISESAGKGAVKVSTEVMDVVETALKVAGLSKGAFDPTVGVFSRVWDFTGEKAHVPDKKELASLLPLVDYRSVKVDRKASTVRLGKKGMRLNLGGVAKGYIVGKALEVLRRHGVEWAVIRAGGDLTVFQKDLEQDPFVIGIQDPRDKKKLLGILKVANGLGATLGKSEGRRPVPTAVTTSGDYERFFIKDGKRYHHIIDPRTGYPAAGCRSVTIVTSDPALADALSTTVFVLGPEKGMKLVEEMEGVEAVIVDDQGRITVSSGLKDDFEPEEKPEDKKEDGKAA